MNFNYCYKIIYESGETYDRRRNELSVEISKEDYKKIITGVLQERPIDQIEGISDVIDKMTENVEFADRFMNKNGSLRKTPLKKKRAISKLEFFIPEYEYRRLKKMKNPIETLERPVEHMTVYRNDGSSVTLTAENGRVSIVDSREKNVRHIIVTVNMNSELTQWLEENLEKNDLLLTPEYSMNEVTMSGAMLYCGWPYYAWSAGYDTNYRAAQAVTIYTTSDSETLKKTVQQEKITYILFEEGSEFEQQECREDTIAAAYEKVYETQDGRIRIYKTTE